MEAPEFPRASVRDFLNVIFKRKFQILLFFIITVATVTAATFLARPTYEAAAQILVKTGRESIYVPATGSGSPVISINREEQINSEVEILKSQSLAKDVISSLGAATIYPDLGNHSKGILASIFPDSKDENSPSPVDSAFLALQSKLSVDSIKKSNVIAVSFKHTDPAMAATVVNTLANLYLQRHVDVHKTPHSYEFFQEQSEILNDKLNRSEASLKALKRMHNVTALEDQQKILLQRSQDLRMGLHATESQAVEVENRIQQLSQQLKSIPRTIAQGEEVDHTPILINTLESRLVELQLEEKQLLTKYTEQSRLVQHVRNEIAMVQKKLAQYEKKRFGKTRSGVNPTHQNLQEELLRSKADLKALTAKSESQRQQLAAYKKELDELNKIEVAYNQLQQKVDVDRENYRLYLTKFEESRISDAMDSRKIASVNLIEPAQVPLKPVSPKKFLNLVLGLFLGALGGLGLAFFLHYLDDSLESIEEIEDALDVPVLISIPYDKKEGA